MKKSLLSLLALASFATGLHAESFEEHFGVLAGQLNASNVQRITGYSTMQAAMHAYACSEDMADLEAQAKADRIAFIARFQNLAQDYKNKAVAETAAKAKSKHTWVTVYGSDGATSVRYDGLDKPTARIDYSTGPNRDETTYTDLEK
jgi:hypothetical protein